jgi:fatty acid desaturase
MKAFKPFSLPLAVLLLAACACRPVLTIGWGELIALLVLIAVLLWPLLLRIYRTLEVLRKSQQESEKDKKGQ